MLTSYRFLHNSQLLGCTLPFGFDDTDPISDMPNVYFSDFVLRCIFGSVVDLGWYDEDCLPLDPGAILKGNFVPSVRPVSLGYSKDRDMFLHGSALSGISTSFDCDTTFIHGENPVDHLTYRGNVAEGAGETITFSSPVVVSSHPDSDFSDSVRLASIPGTMIQVSSVDFSGNRLNPLFPIRGRFRLLDLLSSLRDACPLMDIHVPSMLAGGTLATQSIASLQFSATHDNIQISYVWSGKVWSEGSPFQGNPLEWFEGVTYVTISTKSLRQLITGEWITNNVPSGVIHFSRHMVGTSSSGPIDDLNTYSANDAFVTALAVVSASPQSMGFAAFLRGDEFMLFSDRFYQRLRDICVGNFASTKIAIDNLSLMKTNGIEFLAEFKAIFSLIDRELLGRLILELQKPFNLWTLKHLAAEIASQYLTLVFGIRPTAEAVSDFVTGLILRFKQWYAFISSGSLREIRGGFATTYDLGYTQRAEVIYRTKASVKMPADSALSLMLTIDQLGLLPTFSRVWETIPYTWFLDQFLNVGGLLDNAETSAKFLIYDFNGFVHSQRLRQYLSDVELAQYNITPLTSVYLQMYRREISTVAPTLRDTTLDLASSHLNAVTSGAWLITKA